MPAEDVPTPQGPADAVPRTLIPAGVDRAGLMDRVEETLARESR
ncbi:hypothetical protein ACIBIZ_11045 [Nonomuraea spiralis]